jgi:hypothetical protein
MPLLKDTIKSDYEKAIFEDWIKVRSYVNELTGKRPDINGILFLIGMTEIGQMREFSKEEKQDLMHIGLCALFEDVYYKRTHQDDDGWLHFDEIGVIEKIVLRDQENLIKEKIIGWFKKEELIH